MGRPSKTRALAIWMNGERVGTWTTHAGRPDEFVYGTGWLSAPGTRPISLSMPLRPTAYKGEVVSAYFDNLLPENRRMRERLQRRFNTASAGAFDLLSEIGRDCVGAIQLLPDGHGAPDARAIRGAPLGPAKIGRLLAPTLAPGGPEDEAAEFRISLAGAQEKIALLRLGKRWLKAEGSTPTTHILKLPIGVANRGIDLSTSVENEWLCAQILREYGLAVAPCWMDQFGDQKVLVVERFDRRMATDGKWIVRLPQEDMCQATGTSADRKYESEGGPGIRKIMNLLLGSSRAEEDRRTFFKTHLLFWMLCAIDGHAKNFSVFLEAGGGYRLTPLYDVLSAFPVLGTSAGKLSPKKATMAMAVEATSRHYRWATMLPRHWEETANRCGVGRAFRPLVEELIERTAGVIRRVEPKIPKGFPEHLAVAITRGLSESCRKLKQHIA